MLIVRIIWMFNTIQWLSDDQKILTLYKFQLTFIENGKVLFFPSWFYNIVMGKKRAVIQLQYICLRKFTDVS